MYFLFVCLIVVKHLTTFEQSTSLKTQFHTGFLLAAGHVGNRGRQELVVLTSVGPGGRGRTHDRACSGMFALSKHGLKNPIKPVSSFKKKKKK